MSIHMCDNVRSIHMKPLIHTKKKNLSWENQHKIWLNIRVNNIAGDNEQTKKLQEVKLSGENSWKHIND